MGKPRFALRCKIVDEGEDAYFFTEADIMGRQPNCLTIEVTREGVVIETSERMTLYPWARVLWADWA